jgi:hypothetical protein
MNNFKLLTETKTIITKWAVPQEAKLEDMSTGILYDYCLEQVYHEGVKVEPPKVQLEFSKTLEMQEISAEEQQDAVFYPPPPKPLDVVIDTIETLLIQKETIVELDLINSYEELELLKRWITMRMASLVE